MKKHDHLKDIYPEYVSLEKLYKICRIAKSSARYLVTSGIIPSIDSGKQTRRYKIHIDNVIAYLQQRDESGSMIPVGAANPNRRRESVPAQGRVSFSHLAAQGEECGIAEYFGFICADYPDILTVLDIEEITGIQGKSLLNMVKEGNLRFITDSPQYLIPKPYFMEFVATRRFLEFTTASGRFREVVEGFKEWKPPK